MTDQSKESILYAKLGSDIVVIRVEGRGNHLNAVNLRKVFDQFENSDQPPRYVIDLDQCESMDSTFMGTLAGVALKRRSAGLPQMIVTNISGHVRRLLETLGLKFLIDMRPDCPRAEAIADDAFERSEGGKMDRLERTVMMIEAHEQLIDVADDNAVKFQGVIDSLRDSLQRETDEKKQ